MWTTEILNCGHPSTPKVWEGGSGTPGYAVVRATVGEPERRICYRCADARERESLKTADRVVAYLVPIAGKAKHELTTWTGGLLARVTDLRRTRHNIGGWLYRFNAIDVHGQHWYGTSPGVGMYARMRKAKTRKGGAHV